MLHTFETLTDKHGMWILDEKRFECQYQDCQCIFTQYNRKHHCHACGEIFCSKHFGKCRFKRNKRLDHDINDQNDEKWIKVCYECE